MLLRLASGVWLVVGSLLAVTGIVWLARYGDVPTWTAVPVAVVLGWVKARVALRPLARSNRRRLLAGPARRPWFAVYEPRVWVLVALFMTLGAVLRRSELPRPWLGLVYLAVGIALVLGARVREGDPVARR